MSKFDMVFIVVSSAMFMITSGTITNYNMAKFRIYIHEYTSGPNETLYEVARANITTNSPTSFGRVIVGDILMTSGPDMNTGKLGRAQGFAAYSGLTESTLLLNVNFVFTAGKYQGSSLIILGRKLLSNVREEIPIVGGTGLFRLAQGYTISYTYSNDPINGYTVNVYDFIVYLY